MAWQNAYQILGVSETASDDAIKERYHKLAKRWHPDAPGNKDNQEAAEKFREITAAYKSLNTPEKRKAYDATLKPATVKPPDNPLIVVPDTGRSSNPWSRSKPVAPPPSAHPVSKNVQRPATGKAGATPGQQAGGNNPIISRPSSSAQVWGTQPASPSPAAPPRSGGATRPIWGTQPASPPPSSATPHPAPQPRPQPQAGTAASTAAAQAQTHRSATKAHPPVSNSFKEAAERFFRHVPALAGIGTVVVAGMGGAFEKIITVPSMFVKGNIPPMLEAGTVYIAAYATAKWAIKLVKLAKDPHKAALHTMKGAAVGTAFVIGLNSLVSFGLMPPDARFAVAMNWAETGVTEGLVKVGALKQNAGLLPQDTRNYASRSPSSALNAPVYRPQVYNNGGYSSYQQHVQYVPRN